MVLSRSRLHVRSALFLLAACGALLLTGCGDAPAPEPAVSAPETPAAAPAAPQADPVPELIATVRRGATPGERLTAFDTLLKADDERVIPLLIDVAGAGWDQEMISLAIEILSQAGIPQARPAIERRLNDPDSRLRYQATVGLGRFPAQEVTPLIIRQLEDSSDAVGAGAAAVLAARTGIERPWPTGDTPDAADQRETTAAAWQAWWREQGGDGFGLTVAHRSHTFEGPSAPIERPEAPDIALQDLQGKEVRIGDLRGKAVLLNFWATWCTPCIVETQDLLETASTLGDQAVVLGVISEFRNPIPAERALQQKGAEVTPENVHALQQQAVAMFLLRHRVTYPQVWGTADMLDVYGSSKLPTTIVLRPDGRIHRRLISTRDTADFVALLRDAMATAS